MCFSILITLATTDVGAPYYGGAVGPCPALVVHVSKHLNQKNITKPKHNRCESQICVTAVSSHWRTGNLKESDPFLSNVFKLSVELGFK